MVPYNVTHVRILPSARRSVLNYHTFSCHPDLRIVILNEDLKEIGVNAFFMCSFLDKIDIPHAVRVIKKNAFGHCSRLNRVIVGTGLEEMVTFP